GDARDLVRSAGAGEDSGEHRIDVRAPVGHDADGACEIGQGRLLEHEAVRAGVDRLDDEGTLGIAGVEDHAGGRPGSGQPAGDLDAAEPGHADVDDGDVGRQLLDLFEGVEPVAGAAYELDAVLAREETPDRVDGCGMVVGDEAPQRHALTTYNVCLCDQGVSEGGGDRLRPRP